MAFDYGIREVWVVNVGDLKPMELPISYFLDLAYDFEAWGAVQSTGLANIPDGGWSSNSAILWRQEV